MSFFNFGRKKEEATPAPAKVSLTKEESLAAVNLRKEAVQKISLEKKPLTNLISRVCLVVDYSGSMDDLYRNGTVQRVIERLLPIAMQFDDNAEMEFWIFHNSFYKIGSINLSNYFNYIKNNKILETYSMGGTEYAPVMNDVIKFYDVQNAQKVLPTLALFITDGDNGSRDKDRVTKLMTETCTKPIFWQFVGVKNTSKEYLQKLDDLPNREVDNADFFNINDIDRISDEELYQKLLTEYPGWIQTVKEKGII